MDRKQYPANWNEIALEVKERAAWTCQDCGKVCRKPGEPGRQTHTLTVAHLDHNPPNCARENLRALCAPCHLRYDARMHADRAKLRRLRELVERGCFILTGKGNVPFPKVYDER